MEERINRLASSLAPTEFLRAAEELANNAHPFIKIASDSRTARALSELGRAAERATNEPLFRAIEQSLKAAPINELGLAAVNEAERANRRLASFGMGLDAVSRGLQPFVGDQLRALGAALEKDITAFHRVEELQPWLRQLDVLELTAAEGADDLTLTERFKVALDALIGVDPDTAFESPKQRLKTLLKIILVLWAAYHWYQGKLSEADVHQRILEQARVVAAATEAIRQLTQEIEVLKNQSPAIHLEVTAAGMLREAPSGSAARVGRVRSGQVVRLLSVYGRWRYVEVLDDDLHESGIRGWLYRRNVRAPRPRPK
jgi:hypothetical protein